MQRQACVDPQFAETSSTISRELALETAGPSERTNGSEHVNLLLQQRFTLLNLGVYKMAAARSSCIAVLQRMPFKTRTWEVRAVGDAVSVATAAVRLVVVAGLAAEVKLLLRAVRRRRQRRRRRLRQEGAAEGAGHAAGAAGTGLQPRLRWVFAVIRI